MKQHTRKPKGGMSGPISGLLTCRDGTVAAELQLSDEADGQVITFHMGHLHRRNSRVGPIECHRYAISL